MLQASLPPSPRAGGVGYQVDLLARALMRRGHEITAFCIDGGPDDAVYRCTRLPAPTGPAGRLVGAALAFRRAPLDGFDVVHAHGDDWLLGRRARARTFYGTALLEARAATSWRRRAAQCCYYGFEWISSANPWSVAISDRTRRYLPLVGATIPCAYDPEVFHPGGRRTAHPSLLFVAGTLAGRKRGGLLLDAFAEVHRRRPDVTLTIVSRDRVQSPGVRCVGPIGAAELGDLYRSHWILCSTSSYEGFGVPYVEALASGLPVVATVNPGAEEVLAGGRLGVLCTADALPRTLLDLLDDGELRASLSAAGVIAAPPFAVGAVVERYERLYDAVAGRRS